jgi:hypothetical protein
MLIFGYRALKLVSIFFTATRSVFVPKIPFGLNPIVLIEPKLVTAGLLMMTS